MIILLDLNLDFMLNHMKPIIRVFTVRLAGLNYGMLLTLIYVVNWHLMLLKQLVKTIT